MPEIIETTVYRLDELSDAAKDNARAWYREGGFDYEWYDSVFEDFQRIAEILGICLKTRPVRLMGGGTRQEPQHRVHRLLVAGRRRQLSGVLRLSEKRHPRNSRARAAGHAPARDRR